MGLISNGSTIFDNGAMASGFGGNLIFISKTTASASSTVSITSGIDSTYDSYLIYLVNMHPTSNDITFQFQVSTDGGSSYGVSMTTTAFRATHGEDGSSGGLSYLTGADLSNSTSFQQLAGSVGSDNDQGVSGFIQLFSPSSTTFVKHFITNINSTAHSNRTNNEYQSGYINTTSAVDAMQFKFSSGNIGSGDIYLFGIA